MNEPNHREQAIFEAALGLPADQRGPYLDRACSGDAKLRQRVEDLLQAHEQLGDFLEQPPAAVAKETLAITTGMLPVTEKAGDKIDRYKLLQEIGAGAFGVVYMAEQEEPVRRRVALKVIKLGMDTKQVIARFEAERQALALMDHPNIAKVLDAGATETGRPYFVMELVRGIKITDYCDQNNLSTEERLRLFIQVCHAVQHAHQKGIIHRDIKPSNILVTLHDGAPVPKVIDFGIAKATTDQRLTDKTLFTAFEQFIGTPAYMSPEQAEMSGLDIDTRSDIYALGVLLYELLTGKTPFDAKRLRDAGLDEIRRIIREVEPPRPSTRLSALDAPEQTAVAKRRHSEPIKLIHLVSGDLDWIVMKTLEKDRTRRYETANGLAMDLKRHLNHEPVIARPPSVAYRFQKLVRRNKLAFTAASAVFVALLTALGWFSTWQISERNDAQQRANAAEEAKEAATRSRLEAEQLLSRAERAEKDAVEKLWESYRAQAQARRLSSRVGRRFESLDVLRKAVKIRPSVELRNEAIACMALCDLRTVNEWDVPKESPFQFDSRYERYVWQDTNGLVRVHRVADDVSLMTIPGFRPSGLIEFLFSPDDRILLISTNSASESRFTAFDLDRREAVLRKTSPGWRRNWIFSPNGRVLAVGYMTNNMAGYMDIYETSTGKTLQTIPLASLSWGLSFDPQGSMLAVSRERSPVEIWDWQNRKIVHRLSAAGMVRGIAWHPDGRRLAGACSDRRIYVWDVEREEVVTQVTGHQREVIQVQFSHSGDLLRSISWDSTLRFWDWPTGRELLRTEVDSGFDYSFGQGDRRLGYAPGEERRGIWEIAKSPEWRLLRFESKGLPGTQTCAYSPDGRLLASAHGDMVRVWDVAVGRELAILPERSKSISFLPSGEALLVCVANGIRRWPIVSQLANSPTNLVLGPSKEFLLAPAPGSALVDQSGSILAVNQGGVIQILDYSTRRELRRLAKVPPAYAFALSPDGRWCAEWPWAGDRLRVWDVASGLVVTNFTANRVYGAAFSPDSRRLVTVERTECTVLETGSWNPLHSFRRPGVGSYQPRAVVAPDGRLAAMTYSATTVRLFDLETGRELATLEPPDPQQITWLAFSPDGGQLAVATGTDVIQLWDLRLIRQQLAAMTLDWELPPMLPPAARRWSDSINATVLNRPALADKLIAEGKLVEAEALYREWLQTLRNYLQPDDPYLAGELAAYTHTLLAAEEFAEAEPPARECVGIREKQLPDDWLTFNAHSMLGASLLGQKKYADAEPYLVSGYLGMKQREDKIPAAGKVRLKEALHRLQQLCEITGRSDLAAEWKTETTQWYRKEVEQYRKAAELGDVQSLNGLAWLLATCVDPAIRDGRSAVMFAEKAVAATNREKPAMLDTLAAAYAEAGEFAKAVSVQKEAIALLPDEGMTKAFMSRLRLYESNSAYRERP